MPTVHFEASAEGPAAKTELPKGCALVDVCDDLRAPVPFSCRSASCGTCRVEVLAGKELFEEPDEEELDVLEAFDRPDDHRLACQARVKPGPGLIRLRAVDD